MGKRMILAGVLGGIAMYVWSSIAHMALPLGHTGIQEIPNEQALLTSLQATLGSAHGLYFFPAFGEAAQMDHHAGMKEYAKKLAANPSGILIYHPPGASPMMVSQLVIEFLTELTETLLAVFLLSKTRIATFGGRVGFILTAGVLASITSNIPYWNWYGFPVDYTAAYMTMQLVGYLCAGLAVAAVLRNSGPRLA